MNPSRRDFLRMTAAAGLLSQTGPLASRLFAASRSATSVAASGPANPALVVVFLRGAADALNMVIPYGDSAYEAVRPTIAATLAEGVVPLDKTFGLHPALASLQPLFEAGFFAPIVSAGSPHPTRSHFDAQDWMEFAAPGDRSMRDGWLNRYLRASEPAKGNVSEFRSLGMQELLPRSLRGQYPVLAVPTSLGRRKTGRTLDRFERFYGEGDGTMEGGSRMQGKRADDPSGVVESGRITIETLRRFGQIIAASEKKRRTGGTRAASAVSYPSTSFGNRLKQIALVLRANEGLEIAGVDYGGWDDHTQEGGVEGRMAERLQNFGKSLAAFCQDLGPQLEQTSVLVMSEFGRTVHENGNSGTDHGHGGSMLLFGGGVKGGKVHGDWRGLENNALYQGRDLAVTTDFRDVYHSVLKNTFGFDTGKDFFPGYKAKRVRGLY